MSNELIATIVQYGTRFIESYKRSTRAENTELEAQGLSADKQYEAVLAAASINEYVVWQTTDIEVNKSKAFRLSRWNADLDFKSLYIDSPNSDQLHLEVYDNAGNQIIDQRLSRNFTPFNFPANPLPSDLIIKVKALSHIKFVRLIAVPCKILETFYAEEDYSEG